MQATQSNDDDFILCGDVDQTLGKVTKRETTHAIAELGPSAWKCCDAISCIQYVAQEAASQAN